MCGSAEDDTMFGTEMDERDDDYDRRDDGKMSSPLSSPRGAAAGAPPLRSRRRRSRCSISRPR